MPLSKIYLQVRKAVFLIMIFTISASLSPKLGIWKSPPKRGISLVRTQKGVILTASQDESTGSKEFFALGNSSRHFLISSLIWSSAAAEYFDAFKYSDRAGSHFLSTTVLVKKFLLYPFYDCMQHLQLSNRTWNAFHFHDEQICYGIWACCCWFLSMHESFLTAFTRR